jgi:hypothetical protein
VGGAVLEHIEKRGRLQGFPAPPREKLALMKSAIEHRLVVWDKAVGKYELTAVGHERLVEERHKIATGV